MSDIKHIDRIKYIDSYVHHNHTVGVLVEFVCDTTIPSSKRIFHEYVRNIAMQIASQHPATIEELSEQFSITKPDKKIAELMSDIQDALDENIELVRFVRWDSEIRPPELENNDPPPEASAAALRAVE